MLILNVTYQVKKGMRQAFYDKLVEMQVPKLSREEDGNIAYEYFFHVEDEDCLFLLEKWQDDEAFDRHCKSEHFLALQEVKGEYLESSDLQKYYTK
ncbi:MAG: putative quinol monooxygenase [Anaerovoracaceae bacterium]